MSIIRWYCEDTSLQQMYKANQSDACFDLCAAENVVMLPHSRVMVHTGLYTAMEHGYVGIVKPRSGLAVKSGLDVLAGVIDADYRGEVCVVLYNTTEFSLALAKGMRIAQMVVVPCVLTAEQVFSLDDLGSTRRGDNGFGSTGTTTTAQEQQ